jgi:hypothetical protein
MTLRMAPSSTSSHLWASFHFGIVSGTIRASLPKNITVGMVCTFSWRGREEGEGEMTFGDENKGTLTFLGGGKIKGKMRWMGDFDFVGVKDNSASKKIVWPKYVPGWKREYRGINQTSYEAASRARWGGWGGDEEHERSDNSDTDGQGGDSESDPDSGVEIEEVAF